MHEAYVSFQKDNPSEVPYNDTISQLMTLGLRSFRTKGNPMLENPIIFQNWRGTHTLHKGFFSHSNKVMPSPFLPATNKEGPGDTEDTI
jgi:hypothetical protein